MNIQTTKQGTAGTLALIGRFDFSAHRDFRNGYQALLDDAAVSQVIIDLSRVLYLDSSALGMLLLLKQRADELKKQVVLRGAVDVVRKVLDIANFGKLFELR